MRMEALHAVIAREIGRLYDAAGKPISLTPDRLLKRDFPLSAPGLWSANRHCRMVEAKDGWIAVNLARPDDRASVAAWLECDEAGDPWDMVIAHARSRDSEVLVERATLLGLPVARIGEALTQGDEAAFRSDAMVPAGGPATVIDLSALWAGPLCGGLLALSGLPVTRIEDPARPDPTTHSTPELDRWLNGNKQRKRLPLASHQLVDAICSARILITSGRAAALARLGLTTEALFTRNPGLLWIAITAHGFAGAGSVRVGFGDDCAAAGGLIREENGEPRFMGDALADPLTGLNAARRALEYLAEGKAGLLDVALAPTAARFAREAMG